MEIKILQTEEVPKAVQLARGVFEYCLRNTINEAQLIESFYTYVREENIRQLMETQKLTIWAAYDEQNNMVAVSGMQSEGHITLLYVMPYYQRRGYGKKLLLTMREYAREKLELAQVTVNAMPAWTASYFAKSKFQGSAESTVGSLCIYARKDGRIHRLSEERDSDSCHTCNLAGRTCNLYSDCNCIYYAAVVGFLSLFQAI